MSVSGLISSLDAEIARLQQARELLAALNSPKTKVSPVKPTKKRRKMSAAGRARIAEAQRKRWAAQKKAAK